MLDTPSETILFSLSRECESVLLMRVVQSSNSSLIIANEEAREVRCDPQKGQRQYDRVDFSSAFFGHVFRAGGVHVEGIFLSERAVLSVEVV